MPEPLDPLAAVAGGVLIGVAACALLLLNGRIAGNSGMIHGLLPPQRGQSLWRILYLLGLVAGAYGFFLLTGKSRATFDAAGTARPVAVLIGGLLVGLGTRLSGGCTSGHGVCGLGRRSPRSLAATLAFMASGIVTVFVIRHLFGWQH